MKEAIDIYVKLLVAIISFIAPLIIHLLSVFSDGIAVVRRKFEEEERQMSKLIKEELKADDADIKNLVSTNSAAFKDKQEKNKCQLQLLEPKRQIKRIFPTLFLSLLFMMIFSLVNAHKESLLENNLDLGDTNLHLIILFSASLICSFLGVLFLKQVAWAVIEVKQEIADDKEKRTPKNGLTKSS